MSEILTHFTACKANAATAAEMARWLWAVGLEAQRAARA